VVVYTMLTLLATYSHGYGRAHGRSQLSNPQASGPATPNGTIKYPPLSRGLMSLQMVQTLLTRYETCYHRFFPLANPAAFDPLNLPTIAAKEPHLLAAILTVASKDEADWMAVHEACSSHMRLLIADLVYSGIGSVEAVEAMLILAEWVPRRPHSTPAVGRGEEDQAAWMYVGTAVRLGYLLGIDRSGFRMEKEAQSAELNRKRLAWAACYMSDRQISVRVGKAFWSRGPGPMTNVRAILPVIRGLTDVCRVLANSCYFLCVVESARLPEPEVSTLPARRFRGNIRSQSGAHAIVQQCSRCIVRDKGPLESAEFRWRIREVY